MGKIARIGDTAIGLLLFDDTILLGERKAFLILLPGLHPRPVFETDDVLLYKRDISKKFHSDKMEQVGYWNRRVSNN